MQKISWFCLVVLLPLVGLGVPIYAQTETVTVTYQGPVRIPDDDDDGIILPVLMNRALNITKVTLTVDIDHPNIGDLEIRLVNPTGRVRLLTDMHCNGTRNLSNFTFDTSAPMCFGDFCPTQAGQMAAPREEIDTWGSDTSLGVWELRVVDDRGGATGFVLNYRLRITGTLAVAPTFSANTIFDAASGRTNAISPGGLVWIYGGRWGRWMALKHSLINRVGCRLHWLV
jgi:subtilisin-like proprotein convertase family protein